MKKILRTDRDESSNINQPSQIRRKLLMGCAYLPAMPLLAMLGGCKDDSLDASAPTSTFEAPPVALPVVEVAPVAPAPTPFKVPLPPYSTTDILPPPPAPPVIAPPTSVPVIRVPKQQKPPQQPAVQQQVAPQSPQQQPVPQVTPQPPKPTRMNVGIYSLQYYAFAQVSTRKTVPEGTIGAIVGSITPATQTKTTVGSNPVKPFDTATVKLLSPDSSTRLATKDPKFDGTSPEAWKQKIGQDDYKKIIDAGYLVETTTEATSEIKVFLEDIETYLKRALDNRFALLYRAMVTAFAKRPPKEFDVSFFTAPEFYWNVPWNDFLNEAEMQMAAKLCLDTVTSNVRTLISKFPANKYGKIVLLPGSTAVLKANLEARNADGTLAGVEGIVYDASNHLVCVHNLPLDDGKKRPAYMIWPKRVASAIDFGSCTYHRNIDLQDLDISGVNNFVQTCSLKNGSIIKIAHVSSSVGRSYDTQGQLISEKFKNDIVEGLPFGIDLCLDYQEASIEKDEYRMAQLDARDYKLNFYIAAGGTPSVEQYATVPYVQYEIYNEGSYSGKTEVSKLNWTKGIGRRLGTISKEVLLPFDAKFMYDEAGEKILNRWTKQPQIDDAESYIAVDKTAAYKAPQDADSTGIPNVLDDMNDGRVRIWALDVDVSDTVPGSDTLIASSPELTATPEEKEIQFIE